MTLQSTAHTHSMNWTAASTTWLIDGTAVRALYYADALGGAKLPADAHASEAGHLCRRR